MFYHVQPRDVGHQSGSFQDAFLDHEKDADQEKKELIEKWRIALEKAAKLSGYHVITSNDSSPSLPIFHKFFPTFFFL